MYEGNVPEKIIHERTGHLSFTRIPTYFLAAPCKSDFINLVSEAVAQVSVGLSLILHLFIPLMVHVYLLLGPLKLLLDPPLPAFHLFN